MEKGFINIYTGNGKGKTTAAFGLAVRAALADKKVYIGQFVKDMKYSETGISDYLKNIVIEQLGNGCYIYSKPSQEDIEKAKESLHKCSGILKSNQYDLVILDEVIIAIYLGLLDEDHVIEVVSGKHPNVEVVLTGRYASNKLIQMADLVTDMQEIKHYYTKGVLSRKGFDC
ncbi:cob(I)yrinic acid a,c-diamide adenosyltransferase [Gudongella sp. SC589]|jgi:cob(I)alamin adenosyltransferase|uniref:cob(I)yrinic acid a,c-diamide adenosyltransferase n=1 Tax=Gudongella sp. SC589 TaxID=3385990 RepID=UPI003904ACC5